MNDWDALSSRVKRVHTFRPSDNVGLDAYISGFNSDIVKAFAATSRVADEGYFCLTIAEYHQLRLSSCLSHVKAIQDLMFGEVSVERLCAEILGVDEYSSGVRLRFTSMGVVCTDAATACMITILPRLADLLDDRDPKPGRAFLLFARWYLGLNIKSSWRRHGGHNCFYLFTNIMDACLSVVEAQFGLDVGLDVGMFVNKFVDIITNLRAWISAIPERAKTVARNAWDWCIQACSAALRRVTNFVIAEISDVIMAHCRDLFYQIFGKAWSCIARIIIGWLMGMTPAQIIIMAVVDPSMPQFVMKMWNVFQRGVLNNFQVYAQGGAVVDQGVVMSALSLVLPFMFVSVEPTAEGLVRGIPKLTRFMASLGDLASMTSDKMIVIYNYILGIVDEDETLAQFLRDYPAIDTLRTKCIKYLEIDQKQMHQTRNIKIALEDLDRVTRNVDKMDLPMLRLALHPVIEARNYVESIHNIPIRVEPLWIHLEGKPGCGKTHCENQLIADAHHWCKLKYASRDVVLSTQEEFFYSIDFTSSFFIGYWWQPILVIEELFYTVEPEILQRMVIFILKFVSKAVQNMEDASLKGKGNCADSPILISTSNLMFNSWRQILKGAGIIEPNAVARRVYVCLLLTVPDKYRKYFRGTRYDMDALRKEFPDLSTPDMWEFTVDALPDVPSAFKRGTKFTYSQILSLIKDKLKDHYEAPRNETTTPSKYADIDPAEAQDLTIQDDFDAVAADAGEGCRETLEKFQVKDVVAVYPRVAAFIKKYALGGDVNLPEFESEKVSLLDSIPDVHLEPVVRLLQGTFKTDRTSYIRASDLLDKYPIVKDFLLDPPPLSHFSAGCDRVLGSVNIMHLNAIRQLLDVKRRALAESEARARTVVTLAPDVVPTPPPVPHLKVFTGLSKSLRKGKAPQRSRVFAQGGLSESDEFYDEGPSEPFDVLLRDIVPDVPDVYPKPVASHMQQTIAEPEAYAGVDWDKLGKDSIHWRFVGYIARFLCYIRMFFLASFVASTLPQRLNKRYVAAAALVGLPLVGLALCLGRSTVEAQGGDSKSKSKDKAEKKHKPKFAKKHPQKIQPKGKGGFVKHVRKEGESEVQYQGPHPSETLADSVRLCSPTQAPGYRARIVAGCFTVTTVDGRLVGVMYFVNSRLGVCTRHNTEKLDVLRLTKRGGNARGSSFEISKCDYDIVPIDEDLAFFKFRAHSMPGVRVKTDFDFAHPKEHEVVSTISWRDDCLVELHGTTHFDDINYHPVGWDLSGIQRVCGFDLPDSDNTVSGDCGSPYYVIRDNRVVVVGFHCAIRKFESIAGVSRQSIAYARPVDARFFEKLSKVTSGIVAQGGIDCGEISPHVLNAESCMIGGYLHKVNTSEVTQFESTVFDGVPDDPFFSSKFVSAPLSTLHSNDGSVIRTALNSFRKLSARGGVSYDPPFEGIQIVAERIQELKDYVAPGPYLEAIPMEVVAQAKPSIGLAGMARGKSAGFPFSAWGVSFNDWFESGDLQVFKPEYLSLLNTYETDLARGTPWPVVYQVTAKDEKLKRKKLCYTPDCCVEDAVYSTPDWKPDAKHRLFQNAPKHYVLLCRKYFAGFAKWVDACFLNIAVAHGVKPSEYSLLLEHVGDQAYAGDYEGMDTSFFPELTISLFYLPLCFYGNDGASIPVDEPVLARFGVTHLNPDNYIRWCLWIDIVWPMLLYMGYLLSLNGINPSGNFLTTLLNSLTQLVFLCQAYYEVTAKKDFFSHVRAALYGDDSLWHDHSRSLSASTFKEVVARYGFKWTDAMDKTQAAVLRPTREADFLGRGFFDVVLDDGSNCVWGAMTLDRVARIAQFCKSANRNPLLAIPIYTMQLVQLVEELWPHGKATYKKCLAGVVSRGYAFPSYKLASWMCACVDVSEKEVRRNALRVVLENISWTALGVERSYKFSASDE